MSKRMFDTVRSRTGIDINYDNLVIPLDYYDQVLVRLKEDDEVVGFNVTIPYKVKICGNVIPDIDVRNCGAVNCVKIDHKTGVFYGYNTDWKGIFNPLKNRKVNNAIIAGAGGAARAACYALTKMDVKDIFLFNRSVEKADSLKTFFPQLKLLPLERLDEFVKLNGIDLIINTTPLGMNPNPWTSIPIQMETLEHCRIVFDAVYKPLKTKLLVYAEKSGCECINGLEMLIDQHIENVKIWQLPMENEIIKILESFKRA
ncbi:MAG TPA: hypothetical protein PK466_00665 [Thermotogota bacterium]|nr:hypothetical protein [Thermotogota bacterium]HPJ87606.1 hypothetical protein [Thermotogota bacterium]HPR94811.1 hypothetical protein [Thermotogota bacterium]